MVHCFGQIVLAFGMILGPVLGRWLNARPLPNAANIWVDVESINSVA